MQSLERHKTDHTQSHFEANFLASSIEPKPKIFLLKEIYSTAMWRTDNADAFILYVDSVHKLRKLELHRLTQVIQSF